MLKSWSVRGRWFRWMAAAVLAMPLLAGAAPRGDSPRAAAYDAAFEATLARYRLPGLAVGVIEDGEVAWVRTAGELRAGSGNAITDRSLFKIASNSKAMTASVLARLVQAGKLRWDDPVVEHLPDFAMHDPWVTRHITVRDLLVHNSGLPEGGGDLMLWPEPNAFTRADILHGLRYIAPAYGFRAGYAYDNLLYVVAGEVAAAAGGASYEELVRREIFEPLGLRDCRVGEFRLDEAGEVAQPHMRTDTGNAVIHGDDAVVPAITSAAAGGIRCSLRDMLAWARNWLAPTPAQLEWLGPAQRAEMWKARTPMPISARRRAWDDTHYLAYAFGFRLADVDGEWTVSHTGTLSGMYSAMMLLPDRRSGFVMLTNGNGDAARTVLTEALLKQFTAPDRARGVDSYAEELERDAAATPARSRAPDISGRRPASAAEMRDWLGTWRDPWFGEVTLCPAGEGVEWRSAKSPRMHGQVSVLGGRHLVHWDDVGVDVDAWLDFSGQGDARALRMAKVDPEGDFSSDYEDLAFVRIGDCPSPAPRLSPAKTAGEAGLVDIRTLVADIAQDIKYAGSDNFVGAPVDGYRAPKCFLLPAAAQALARVERTLRPQGLRLRIWDCYRPARAVAHFVRWAHDAGDQRTKCAHYPDLDKSVLLGDYIAPVSGHSRAATVDLTLERCAGDACAPLDMGTEFDLFGPRAHTDSPMATPSQRANRDLLRAAMAAQGFRNYPLEWWHYTLDPEPAPGLMYDVPVE